MNILLKPLAVAAMLTATMIPAHAEFGSTNVEKGCTILSIAVTTRIENMPWMTPEKCARARAGFKKADETQNWIDCAVVMLGTRNRVRGVPDFDKPFLDVRKNVLKGCAMMISDMDEEKADYISQAVKE